MDPPPAPPPSSLPSNLSSLLSQLQGTSSSPIGPSSVSPPERSSPPGGGQPRTIDDLFRTLSNRQSAPSPHQQGASSPPPSEQHSSLLSIFNTASPSATQPPTLPLPTSPQTTAPVNGHAHGQSLNGSYGLVSGGGGNDAGKTLLELLMGGGSSGAHPGEAHQQTLSQPQAPQSDPAHHSRTSTQIESTGSPPPQHSMNPLLPSSPATQPNPNLADPSPLVVSMSSPSPPALDQQPLHIAVVARTDPSPDMPSSAPPAARAPPPALFQFVSDFDAFGPPITKRSKSVVPPGSAPNASVGGQFHPLARSISTAAAAPATQSPVSAQESAQQPLIDGLPPLAGGLPALVPESFPLTALFPDVSAASNVVPAVGSTFAPTSQSSLTNLATAAAGGDDATSRRRSSPAIGHHRTGSGSSRAGRAEVTVAGTFRAKGFVEVERKHRRSGSWHGVRGPRVLDSAHTTVDVSLPNLESLVQADVVSRRPITIIKSDLSFASGRTVGSSESGVIAYAMNKGRVRLLDEATGSRALLKLPADWFARDAQVANLELEGQFVAACTTDGGLIVWKFPSTWTTDDPECEIVYAVSAPEDDALRFKLVKWHGPSTLGVSSGSNVVLLDLPTISQAWLALAPQAPATPDFLFDGENTRRISFSADPVVGFGFITSSTDGSGRGYRVVILSSNGQSQGTLAMLAVTDEGESSYSIVEELYDRNPSSVMFVDEGNVVVGSEKDTVAELYAVEETARQGFDLRGSVRFEKPTGTPGLFAKIEYDPRRQLLWVSNTARSSLFALRLCSEADASVPFGQLAEFPIDAAISSFNVSRSQTDFEIYCAMPHGIDQITISDASLNELFTPSSTKDDIPAAVKAAVVKTEETDVSVVAPAVESTTVDEPVHPASTDSATSSSGPRSRRRSKAAAAAATTLTPPEDSFGAPGTAPSASKASSAPASSASGEAVSSGLLAEIKKVEDNLKIKMTSLLEKQTNRLETNDLERQQTVFKLIANELKSNTTKVLQTEMRTTVLPALVEVTRSEVRALVQAEIASGLKEAMTSSLPSELERHLNSRSFASVVFPSIDKAIKELIHKTLLPAHQESTSAMYEALSREIRADMVAIRKDSEQSPALVETHALVQDMSQTMVALGTQVGELQRMVAKLQGDLDRQQPSSPLNQIAQSISSPAPNSHAGPSLNGISPQMQSHPINVQPAFAAYPQPPPHARQPSQPPSGPSGVDLDELWTETLMSTSPNALPELLSRISPPMLDQMLPVEGMGPSPLSQTVLLSLVHKLTDLLSRTPLQSPLFPSALVFVQRASRILDPRDPVIAPYASRVISVVLSTLAKMEDLILRSAGSGGVGDRERESVIRMLRSVGLELGGKR